MSKENNNNNNLSIKCFLDRLKTIDIYFTNYDLIKTSENKHKLERFTVKQLRSILRLIKSDYDFNEYLICGNKPELINRIHDFITSKIISSNNNNNNNNNTGFSFSNNTLMKQRTIVKVPPSSSSNINQFPKIEGSINPNYKQILESDNNNDDDINISSYKLKLTDPLFYDRIKTPVKFKNICTHIECFDFDSLKEYCNSLSGTQLVKLKCPICNKSCYKVGCVLDLRFKRYLEEYPNSEIINLNFNKK